MCVYIYKDCSSGSFSLMCENQAPSQHLGGSLWAKSTGGQ